MPAASPAPTAAPEARSRAADDACRELVGLYRGAIDATAALPLLGGAARGADGRRKGPWASRPLARLFVQGHVRRRLQRLRRHVELESASRSPAEDLRPLRELAEDLGVLAHHPAMVGGAVPTVLRRGVKLAFVPAAVVFVRFFVGLDLSGWGSFRESLGMRLAAGGLGHDVWTLFLLLFMLYVFMAPFPLMFGFRAKRAVFLGDHGNVPGQPISLWQVVYTLPKRPWTRAVPGVAVAPRDIYQAEVRAFASLGRPAPREFPLDVALGPLPFYLLLFLVIMGMEGLGVGAGGPKTSLWFWSGYAMFLLYVASIFKQAYGRLRERGFFGGPPQDSVQGEAEAAEGASAGTLRQRPS